MNTLTFIAGHNTAVSEAAQAKAEMLRTRGMALFNDSIRAEARAVEADEAGDAVTRVWFEAHAEWLAEKSDQSFAAALDAARGL